MRVIRVTKLKNTNDIFKLLFYKMIFGTNMINGFNNEKNLLTIDRYTSVVNYVRE